MSNGIFTKAGLASPVVVQDTERTGGTFSLCHCLGIWVQVFLIKHNAETTWYNIKEEEIHPIWDVYIYSFD